MFHQLTSELSERPYRYFYAINVDVDTRNPGAVLKVDTWTGELKTWFEADFFSSEPVFVPEPNVQEEDAGVLLCVLLWGSCGCRVNLVLRVTFDTPSPAPKCIHGWFLADCV